MRLFEVAIERSASADELADVRAAFADAGLNASVRASIEFKSAESDAIASLLVIGPITAFLSAFAGAAGKDAYHALKTFVARAGRRRHRPNTSLWLQDSTGTHIDVVVGPDLPDNAYRAIFELDFTSLPSGASVHYDEQIGKWMNVFEAKPVPRRPGS